MSLKFVAWVLSACVVSGLFAANYGRIACLYDYSVIINGSYLLGQSLVPHTDFVTPVQNLPLILARLSELGFGDNSFALGWGNLLVALLFTVWIAAYLRGVAPVALSLFFAVSVVSATALQHSIIWYNTVAMLLTCAVIVVGARISIHIGPTRRGDLAQLILFSLLLGMTKLNFLAAGIASVSVFLFIRILLERGANRWPYVKLLFFFVPVAVCAGPIADILVSGGNGAGWYRDVIERASSRVGYISYMLSSNERLRTFLTGIYYNFYPNAAGSGVVTVFALGYAAFLLASVNRVAAGIAALLLTMFFVLTTVLIVSNVETHILTSSLFLIGIFTSWIIVRSQPAKTNSLRNTLQTSLVVASCAYFLAISSISIFRHSRISYCALGSPLVNTDIEDPSNYLYGTQLTQNEYFKFRIVNAFMKQSAPAAKDSVFFGPSLEYNYRNYNLLPPAHLPLWYQEHSTWNRADVPRLLSALRRARVDYFVISPDWANTLPPEFIAYAERNYQRYPVPVIEGAPADIVQIWERRGKQK